jgi:Ca2+-binding EF-hand superfamily protein
MSKKKIAVLAVGGLLTLGAIAAVAQGHRGGRMGAHSGMDMDDPLGRGMMGRPGIKQRFSGGLSADDFDTRTRERFAALDKNSDGSLDASEIEAGLARGMERRGWRGLGRNAGAAAPGDRMISMFDSNKDGKVTKDEFEAYLKRQFAEADLNNDGRISDEDLPPALRGRGVLAGDAGRGAGMGFGLGGGRGGMMGGGHMLGYLRDADANKDSVVTSEEALASGLKRFAAMDHNKDTVLDKADFEALRKETTDYRVKRFIHHFGADKDGKVSREQFAAKAKERFARMDRDGDGRVSGQELRGSGMMGLGLGGHMGWSSHGGRHGEHMGGDHMGRGGMMPGAPSGGAPASPKN